MTIVAQGQGWWMEYIESSNASLAAGGFQNTDIVLERRGTYLGGSVSLVAALAATVASDVACQMQDVDTGAAIVFGVDLRAIRLQRTNNDASAAIFRYAGLILLGKNNNS